MKLTAQNCRVEQQPSSTKPGTHMISAGFQNSIPPGLKHNGCMWIYPSDRAFAYSGIQSRRCKKPVRWLFGKDRVYCQKHGRIIFRRGEGSKQREAMRSQQRREKTKGK